MAYMLDMGMRCSPRSHGVTHLVQDPAGAWAQLPKYSRGRAYMTVLQRPAQLRGSPAASNALRMSRRFVEHKFEVISSHLAYSLISVCVSSTCLQQ